ncbi:MAG: hypothetical protein A3F67_10880 [Verrucomicrobia bacterium RIFCSPHIGHO2_12_FULL_41_10]|nr:MAG: hypothetical protein A3F67_10880 [Verrucomicrobia bacterium RIFCSPHIGHO2_12_FULL_41_10]
MSSRDLSKKLREHGFDCLRVYPDGEYLPRRDDVIINWGNSRVPGWWWREHGTFLNLPAAVERSINKINSFSILQQANVTTPLFTTNIEQAREWATDRESPIVVCRTLVSAHAGRGIVIALTPDEIVEAPLYTKHVRHKREFRVHVFKGRVIDFTEKKKASDGRPVTSEYVRNHDGGWAFCRNYVTLPEDCAQQAINAVKALCLDFGAVDIAYREREDKAFVLEVNTAPGFDIESTTLKRYLTAFINEVV